MEPYREKLVLTYNYLLTVHEELLTRTINIAMSGDLENINSCFKAGDTFKFDKEMFRDSKDQNVIGMIDFHNDLETFMNSFANINGLSEEELKQGESI